MQDKTLTCKDCASQFIFSVREQQFYAEKGFENEPQRCRDCRAQRKTQRANGPQPHSRGDAFDATCAQCGVATTLPFRPRGDRPVYCRSCYSSMAPARA